MAEQLAAILQAALSGNASGDVSTQLLMSLSATVQQQSAQLNSLQQQLQQMEQKLQTASASRDDPKTLGRAEKFKGKTKDGTKGDKDGKEKAVVFEGYCNGCWKWGHRLAYCWNNPKAKPLPVLEVESEDAGAVGSTGEKL